MSILTHLSSDHDLAAIPELDRDSNGFHEPPSNDKSLSLCSHRNGSNVLGAVACLKSRGRQGRDTAPLGNESQAGAVHSASIPSISYCFIWRYFLITVIRRLSFSLGCFRYSLYCSWAQHLQGLGIVLCVPYISSAHKAPSNFEAIFCTVNDTDEKTSAVMKLVK